MAQNLHRTLVRMTEIYAAGPRKMCICVIPAWDTEVRVAVDRAILPDSWGEIFPPLRFFARVNIGAESEEDLVIDGPFEKAGEPSAVDTLS